ncbi:hypothetical protein F2Q69_00011022 [Brassica cretica]|uniref:Pentacotripeptide-repeat region of PRORP domain-containing protein n=1 Tax=Brassica cretica TaxID=69181 RepID=A0A8S9R1N9_BRACR|nr:hypothetical protein F2Q69_00011022 [Brassica cretica]
MKQTLRIREPSSTLFASLRDTITPSSTLDFAYRLYLTEINSGLSEAEKFFKSIPENRKDDTVYTTQLSFYTMSKKTRHKAEATYEKMKEKDLLFKPNPYYKISLYCLLGEANMVNEVLRQMEENGVVHDKTLTENNVLKAYASVPDVEAMEKFLKRIKDETTTPFALAWQTGISMA